MAEINWIPKFIRQFLERRPLHRVTHEEYNELFNLLINQGDHNSQGIADLYAIFGHVQGGIADLLLYGEINADKLGGFLPEYYASKEYVLTQIAAIDLTAITAQLDNKVDKVAGKGLSTNDYTDADKADVAKIDGLVDALENLDVEQIFQTNVTMSNATVTHVLYATEGRVARLAVDHFLTGSSEYLAGAEYIYFQDQQHQYHRFIEGHRRDDLPQVQYTDFDGVPLYWGDAAHSYMTPEVTQWPVMVYVYDLLVKLQMDFEPKDGTMIPKIIHGAGVGNPEHPDWGRGYTYKDTIGLVYEYHKVGGEILSIRLGENGMEFDPPILIFPDTYNDTQIVASSETVLPGIDVICNTRTRIAFDVQMDITASEAMAVTINARVDGVSHRHTVKYFSGAYKDGLCFNGILDVVSPETHTVDITITPSIGSAIIEATEYRLMLTVRDGQATESTPWPEIKVTQPYSKITIAASQPISIGEFIDTAAIGFDDGAISPAEQWQGISIDDTDGITLALMDDLSNIVLS